MKMNWIGAMVLAVGLSGCELYDPKPAISNAINSLGAPSEPDPTDRIRKEHYAGWPKPIREAVDARRLLLGMDKLQVQAALHLEEATIRKQVFEPGTERREKWFVYRLMRGWHFVKMPNSQMVMILFVDDRVADVAW